MASNAPVIIKRKKVIAGGGHHGGAWKVAYADFVTAMMAFFMLMWLLNATTETQRKGLADYFSPTIPMARISGGGENALRGDDATSAEQLQGEAGRSDRIEAAPSTHLGQLEATDRSLPDDLGKIDALLNANSGESTVADDLLQHIVTRVTDEGLIVDLFDLPGAQLFDAGSDQPTALGRELIAVVGDIFRLADNQIAVNGHVRTEPIVRVERAEWDLSTARAQKTRQLLTGSAVAAERIQRIGGFADRVRMHAAPTDLRNNRIELILLR